MLLNHRSEFRAATGGVVWSGAEVAIVSTGLYPSQIVENSAQLMKVGDLK